MLTYNKKSNYLKQKKLRFLPLLTKKAIGFYLKTYNFLGGVGEINNLNFRKSEHIKEY